MPTIPVTSKTDIDICEIYDYLSEINNDRFGCFTVIQTDDNEISITNDCEDETVFTVELTKSKKLEFEPTEEEWACWVCHAFINDLVVAMSDNPLSVKSKPAYTPEPDKFSTFHEYLREMTKVHNAEHYNWLTNQVPEYAYDVVFPDESHKLTIALADLIE